MCVRHESQYAFVLKPTNIVTDINTTASTYFLPIKWLYFCFSPHRTTYLSHSSQLNLVTHTTTFSTPMWPSDDRSQIISYLCPRRSLPRLLPSAKSQSLLMPEAQQCSTSPLWVHVHLPAPPRRHRAIGRVGPSHLAATQKLLQPFTCYTFN